MEEICDYITTAAYENDLILLEASLHECIEYIIDDQSRYKFNLYVLYCKFGFYEPEVWDIILKSGCVNTNLYSSDQEKFLNSTERLFRHILNNLSMQKYTYSMGDKDGDVVRTCADISKILDTIDVLYDNFRDDHNLISYKYTMYTKGDNEIACINNLMPNTVDGNLLNILMDAYSDSNKLDYFAISGPEINKHIQVVFIKLIEIGVPLPDIHIYEHYREDLPHIHIDDEYIMTELIPITSIQYIVSYGLFDVLKYIYEHYPDKVVEELLDYKIYTDRFSNLIQFWKNTPLSQKYQTNPNTEYNIYNTIGFDACKVYFDMVAFIKLLYKK